MTQWVIGIWWILVTSDHMSSISKGIRGKESKKWWPGNSGDIMIESWNDSLKCMWKGLKVGSWETNWSQRLKPCQWVNSLIPSLPMRYIERVEHWGTWLLGGSRLLWHTLKMISCPNCSFFSSLLSGNNSFPQQCIFSIIHCPVSAKKQSNQMTMAWNIWCVR